MISNPLAQPVAALMREVYTLAPEDSLIRAAEELRNSPFASVAVTNGPYLLGVVTENSLLASQASGYTALDPLDGALARPALILQPHFSGADALRAFSESGLGEAVVVDGEGRFCGMIAASDLFPKPEHEPRPHLVGGMATPFGVYLTNGTIRAGAGDLALVSTGMLLFTMLLGSILFADQIALFAFGDRPIPVWVATVFEGAVPTILFFIGLRLLPLSGIHGAEHKVVHALERGEPLVPEIVERMPRVHPRCGTNLAVGGTLFLSLLTASWIPGEDLRLLVALLATLFLWRPLGSLMQQYVTTKKPNDRQIGMGIRAAKELLQKYRMQRHQATNPFTRIWASGMLHVMAGSMLCYAVAKGVSALLGYDLNL
jgi:CBS domain-containing protein